MDDITRSLLFPQITPSTPTALTRYNQPGLPELSYRRETFAEVASRLRIQLSQDPTLKFLNVDDERDWTIALVRAWAAVIDVLGFYQARIINEGFQRTARERLSLLELAREVGYEPRPALSAAAYLAFTVQKRASEPPQQVLVPAHVRIDSVPAPGQRPQSFETSQACEARSEWNAIRPTRLDDMTWRYDIRTSSTSLRLAGTQTGLRPGDTIVLISGAKQRGDDDQPCVIAILSAVTVDLPHDRTVVSWVERSILAAPSAAADLLIQNPQVLAMRRPAQLFGYSCSGIADWQAEPASWQAESAAGDLFHWRPVGIGLPALELRALLRDQAGRQFATTKSGLFRSDDGGRYWSPRTVSLFQSDLYSLALDGERQLLVGAKDGGIYRSKDGGDSWLVLSGDTKIDPYARGLRRLAPRLFANPSLPKTVVRCMAAFQRGSGQALAAGSDLGVFVTEDGGATWRPNSQDLPKWDSKSGQADVVVHDLATSADRKQLFAATSAGVFRIQSQLARTIWAAVVIIALLVAGVTGGPAALAALTGVVTQDLTGAPPAATAVPSATPASEGQAAGAKTALTSTTTLTPTTTPGGAGLIPQLATTLKSDAGQLTALLLPYRALALIAALLLLALAALWRLLGWLLDSREQLSAPSAALLLLPDGRWLAGGQQGLFRSEPYSGLLARLLPNRSISEWRWLSHDLMLPITIVVRDLALLTTFDDSLETVGFTILDVFKQLQNVIFGTGPLLGRLQQEKLQQLIAALTKDQAAALKLPPDAKLSIDRAGRRWLIRNAGGAELCEIRHTGDALMIAQPRPLQSLAAIDQCLYAASELLVFSSTDQGTAWQPLDAGPHLASITRLANIADVLTACGEPPLDKQQPDWFRFALAERLLELALIEPRPPRDSWLVLRQDHATAAQLYHIEAGLRGESRDAARPVLLSRVTADHSGGLATFPRDTAAVLIDSERLALYDDIPIMSETSLGVDKHMATSITIALAGSIPSLKAGHVVILQGKRMRVRSATAGLLFQPESGAPPRLLKLGESLQLLARPLGQTATLAWRLRDHAGVAGIAHGDLEQLVMIPAADDDPLVSEYATLLSVDVEHQHERTIVQLGGVTPAAYDRASVAVLGNIVHATHGRTISDEVLGSSAGYQKNQRLALKQGPLTYLSAATPSGSASTLHLFVNDVEWHETTSFIDQPRDARVFLVRQDAENRSFVVFGDGEDGANLPSNVEQITASYRIGSGAAGNLAAGELTLLQNQLDRIAAVTNPFAASGGVEAETLERLRDNIPLTARATQRIVSLIDYSDFVTGFAGIGRAAAREIHDDVRRLIHITIADRDGNPVEPSSDLFTSLRVAIDRCRAVPLPIVQIDSYQRLFFNLAARVLYQPDQHERVKAIESDIRTRLLGEYVFEKRRFAQPVRHDELIALIQPIAGVVAIELTLLYQQGDPAELRDILVADSARWDAQRKQISPTQLWLINPDNSYAITLMLEPAP